MDTVKEKTKKTSGSVRSILLAKVHIAANDLGLNDQDYRAVLRENFNVSSAKDLSDFQLEGLLRHFESKGWVAKDKNGNPRKPYKPSRNKSEIKPGVGADRSKLMDKMEALLSEIGRLQGNRVPWAYAEAILKRQNGGDHLSWAPYDALLKVVQSLSYRVRQLKLKAGEPVKGWSSRSF
jgi:phage gp16-like protein